MPLSDLEIRKAKPDAKPYKLFDGDGLYLEVQPTGSKLWRLKYYFERTEKRIAFPIGRPSGGGGDDEGEVLTGVPALHRAIRPTSTGDDCPAAHGRKLAKRIGRAPDAATLVA